MLVPRADRIPSEYVSEISGPTVPLFRSRIRNISSSGMLFDYAGPISIGDVVSAHLPGNGQVMATVVRKRDGKVGAKFLDAFDVDAYRRKLASE